MLFIILLPILCTNMINHSGIRSLGVVFISTCIYISVWAQVSKDTNSSTTTYVQCMRGGVAVIGNVPDPFNCYRFYACTSAPPGSSSETIPVPMDCQPGNDLPLFYDFRNCLCAYNSSVCYDGIANLPDFFICTSNYTPT